MLPLRRLTYVLLVEAAALLLLGLGYGGYWLTRGDNGPALLAAAGAALLGLVLGLLARAVSRARPWARTPTVLLNLFPLPLGADALQAGAWWIGVPLLLLAGTVLYLFATPEVRLAFRGH